MIKHINVHDANAMSSQYAIGFPEMPAWMGAVHALQLRINKVNGLENVRFIKTGISCHSLKLHRFEGQIGNTLIGKRFTDGLGTGNSLKSASFIEEARCEITASLLIEVIGVDMKNKELLESSAMSLYCQRIAGGDIFYFRPPQVLFVDEEDDKQVRKVECQLMPGYVIVDRRDLLMEDIDNDQDILDKLLDCVSVHHELKAETANGLTWNLKRSQDGWVIPICSGYKTISGKARLKNQRDKNCDHYFVETVMSLAEFKMPHNFNLIDDFMWEYSVDKDNGLYIVCSK